MIYPDSCLNKIGLFQKKSTPPHPPGFPKLLEPPSPKDFQVQRPPPIWICIKFLDTVILLYTHLDDLLIK